MTGAFGVCLMVRKLKTAIHIVVASEHKVALEHIKVCQVYCSSSAGHENQCEGDATALID